MHLLRRSDFLTKTLIISGILLMWVAPSARALDIFWSTSSGAIGGANADRTGVNQSLITGITGPGGVAVDGTHIYWVSDDIPHITSTIGRANLDGSGVNLGFIAATPFAQGLAVDGTHIYWSDFISATASAIGRANLDGTGMNQSFITGIGGRSQDIAVDVMHIYWTAGTIGRANLDGTGLNQNFITTAPNPLGIAVDGTYVYWANQLSDSIGRANLDGTGVNQNFVTGITNGLGDIAVDETHIYWTGAGTIGRANLDGTGVDQSFISVTGGNPVYIAVDGCTNTRARYGCPPDGRSPRPRGDATRAHLTL